MDLNALEIKNLMIQYDLGVLTLANRYKVTWDKIRNKFHVNEEELELFLVRLRR